jgi:membrane protein YdbS with pleckstrin-like domain
MGWFLFVLLLLAVAFGVAGAVVKAAAFIVLTVLATIAVLALLAALAIRYGWWRFTRDLEARASAGRRGITTRRDDRY